VSAANLIDGVNQLPYILMEVIVRHYLHEESLIDIAETNDAPHQTFHLREKRALDKLRKQLGSTYNPRPK